MKATDERRLKMRAETGDGDTEQVLALEREIGTVSAAAVLCRCVGEAAPQTACNVCSHSASNGGP
jgi:hypothetical protein